MSRTAVPATPTTTGRATGSGKRRALAQGAFDGGPGEPGEHGHDQTEKEQDDRGGPSKSGWIGRASASNAMPAAIRASAVRIQARNVRSLARENRDRFGTDLVHASRKAWRGHRLTVRKPALPMDDSGVLEERAELR